MWLVRAGRHGEREDLALEKNVAVVGWDELEDLSAVSSREQLMKLLETAHPDRKPKTLTNWAGQIWTFLQLVKVDDLVALPLKSRSAIAIGRFTGDYKFRTDLGDAHHTRPVKWLGEYPRSAFEQDLLYSMGAFMTVCQIKRNNAEERVKAVMEGRAVRLEPSGDPTGEIEAAPDLEEQARYQIQEHISRRFRGHDLTRLVAAILDAQGYKVQVSPAGPDGGVDIIAGRGPLGFDAPRLAVQVKSGDSPVDVKVLRELQGVMKNFGAEQGLFVSWGGYKGSVKKEAARVFFEIRLWGADDVVKMIQAHYDHLPDSLQAELPLKRIWTLVQSEDGED